MGKSGAGYSSEYWWEAHVKGSEEICAPCYDLRDGDLLGRKFLDLSEMVECTVGTGFPISVCMLR
jgi:hypothetical protein